MIKSVCAYQLSYFIRKIRKNICIMAMLNNKTGKNKSELLTQVLHNKHAQEQKKYK